MLDLVGQCWIAARLRAKLVFHRRQQRQGRSVLRNAVGAICSALSAAAPTSSCARLEKEPIYFVAALPKPDLNTTVLIPTKLTFIAGNRKGRAVPASFDELRILRVCQLSEERLPDGVRPIE